MNKKQREIKAKFDELVGAGMAEEMAKQFLQRDYGEKDIDKALCPEPEFVDMSDYPDLTNKGGIEPVSPMNFEYFCNKYQLEFGYILENQVVWTSGDPRLVDDKLFSGWLTRAQLDGWKPSKDNMRIWIMDACTKRSTGEQYFRDFVNKKKWDGVDRVDALYQTLNSPDQSQFAKDTFKKWLHGLVALATNTPYKGETGRPRAEICLVLKGPEGIGKSAWCRTLIPKTPISLIKEGLVSVSNKDHMLDTTRYLVWVLSEIEASMGKQSIEALKDFMTKPEANERSAYGTFNTNAPKICSFIGSTNSTYFFPEGQELRRFSVIETPSVIDYKHKIDIQQLWAQCYHERTVLGIKNWFDKGSGEIAQNYQRIKQYVIPDSLRLWIDNYQQSSSSTISEPDLWTQYVGFCKENSLPQSQQKAFKERLITEGYSGSQLGPGKPKSYNIEFK